MSRDVMGVQEVSPGYEFVAENPAVPVGYKQTEVGVIPEDWNPLSIVDFASIKTGPFGTLLKASEYSQGDGVPLISVGEVGTGKFRVSEHTPLVSEKVTSRLSQYVLKKGDIVFGRKGAVDRSALVTDREAGWFLGSDGISVRPDQRNDPAYLAYQFQRHEVQQWLLQNAIGTTMASLNQTVLGRVSIPCPPKHEQKAIATALSDVDALLEELDRLIAKKRDIKQAAMQQLLTGETRLPGFEGAWERVALGDVAAFYKGKGLPKSAINTFGEQPCIHYGELFTQYGVKIEKIISRTDECFDSFLSVANDVLMPTSDVTPSGLAKASCVSTNNVILGGDILVIRTDPDIVNGVFLSSIIRKDADQVLRLVTGTTVYHLYGSDMQKFIFVIPSIAEQNAIVDTLADMDTEIQALEQRRSKTAELKQGMMQELLTGRTRLV